MELQEFESKQYSCVNKRNFMIQCKENRKGLARTITNEMRAQTELKAERKPGQQIKVNKKFESLIMIHSEIEEPLEIATQLKDFVRKSSFQ